MGWVYILLGIVVLMAVGTLVLQGRLGWIAAGRAGEGFHTFQSTFDPAVPPDVLRAVFEQLRPWAGAMDRFPVRTADDLGWVYGIVDDDLDDAILEVVAATGRLLPDEDECRRFGPVVTVRDFVRFVSRLSQGRTQSRIGNIGPAQDSCTDSKSRSQ